VSASEWSSGIVAGVLSAAAYAIAMWAMTRAPVASVASLRETSILFAMLISVFALNEKITAWRGAAALSIVLGVVALRMG
jgi:drug/metabolite transporter (DMT)-like permease